MIKHKGEHNLIYFIFSEKIGTSEDKELEKCYNEVWK